MGNDLAVALATPMGGLLLIVAIVFAILLGILWFLLPFAIFGTKPKLDELKQELVRVNENLQLLIGELRQEKIGKEGIREEVPRNIRATRD